MNFVEKTSTYRELRQDYDLQCLENSRKQDRIIELNRKVRKLEEQIKDLEKEIEILKELKKCKKKHNVI